MYIIISHESDNGKELEATLNVQEDTFSFEVVNAVISGVQCDLITMESKWRVHTYILKHVKNIYKLFKEELDNRNDLSLNDF